MRYAAECRLRESTYMYFIFPATGSLICKDLGEGYCETISEESLASFASGVLI